MKHFITILALAVLPLCSMPAAERGIADFPTITGAQIDTAADSLLLIDGSAENPQGRKMTFAQLANVSGLFASTSHTHAFSAITGKPTTLSGYGITDAAASSHTHAASDIASGTVATARLGSGTANSSTYLRGDQTWATISAGGSDYTVPTGLVSDGRRADTVSVTGTAVTTTGGISFTGYTGKLIRIEGAGASGADFVTTIASVSGSSCTLSSAVTTNVSGVTAFFGTDNTAAIQAAIETARTSTTKKVLIPAGIYLCNLTLYSYQEVRGVSEGNAHTELPSYTTILNNVTGATILMPAQDAPVISYDDSSGNTTDRGCAGAVLSNMAILGSGRKSNYGVKCGDGGFDFSGSITSGSATLTSATSVFTSAHVGRTVYIPGAGAAGAALETTISAYTSGTQVTLTATAGTTVSGVTSGVGGPTSFFGQLYKINNVFISGFKYGLAATRIAEFTVSRNQFTTCTYGLNFGEVAEVYTRHYSDSIMMEGNSFIGCTTNIRVDGSKNLVVVNGDYNQGTSVPATNRFIWMRDSQVVVNSANVEGCQTDAIYQIGGNLTVNSITFGQACSGAIVAAETAGGCSVFAASGTVQTQSGVPIAYKCSATSSPYFLPRGMALCRYTTTAFSTLSGFELTSMLYPNPSAYASTGGLVEEWKKNRATSPYGNHGWLLTTITDGTGTEQVAVSGVQAAISTASATAVVKLGLEADLSWLSNYWECRWLIKDGTASWGTSKWHVGMFAGSSALTPVDGVGFRVDRSASTNIFFEFITNSTVTSVDTGLAAASYTGDLEFLIMNTPSGKFGAIKNSPANGGNWIWAGTVSGTLRGVYATPSIFAGSHTGGNVDIRLMRTQFRELGSNSF